MRGITVFLATAVLSVIFQSTGTSAQPDMNLTGGAAAGQTIKAFLDYSGLQGLSVEEPKEMTGEEKAVVDGARAMFTTMQKSSGVKSKKSDAYPVETLTKRIEGMRVKIEKYVNADFAKQAWEKSCASQEIRKENAEKQKSPYFKTTVLTGGVFVLHINHFEVKLVDGGIRPFPVEIRDDDIEKIKRTLSQFTSLK